MERRRRTYMHKGKLRFKRRLPRKLKKKRNKEWKINHNRYKMSLIKIHGDDWMDYWIFGG